MHTHRLHTHTGTMSELLDYDTDENQSTGDQPKTAAAASGPSQEPRATAPTARQPSRRVATAAAPPAPTAPAPLHPPEGVILTDGTQGLPPKAFANPPYGSTYRAYLGYPSSQTFNTRNLPDNVKKTRTFFGRMVDKKGRTWIAYHLYFKETNEWRLFWFFAPAHLVTNKDQMADLHECRTYRPWRPHASLYSDSYPLGYEGARPKDAAVLVANPPTNGKPSC